MLVALKEKILTNISLGITMATALFESSKGPAKLIHAIAKNNKSLLFAPKDRHIGILS